MKNILLAILTLTLTTASVATAQTPGGVIFKTLVSFTYTNPPNYGWNFESPGHTSALVQGNDGNFYGTTYEGGTDYVLVTEPPTYGYGTVFKMAPDGTFTSLHSFSGPDGDRPVGNLLKGADGNLYGTTYYGGALSDVSSGSLFQITTNGILTTLYSFGLPGDFTNIFPSVIFHTGANPLAGVVQGNDGNFYGTTTTGGDADGDFEHDQGTVFQFTAGGAMNVLHAFFSYTNAAFNVDGGMPKSELTEGPDGNFYGTTYWGGTNFNGTIFRITTNGTFTALYSFSSGAGGTYAPLLLGRDGNFYGTTPVGSGAGGGAGGYGTVFKITTNGIFTILHTFTSGNDGGRPAGGLIQGSDGNFYGTTQMGGAYWSGNVVGGTIFQITTTGTLTTLYSFSGPDGQEPQGALVQGTDGSFYGTTSYGGLNYGLGSGFDSEGYGTIFRITIPPVFQSITQSNGMVALTWSIMPGQTYQLQYTANLASSNWLNLGNAVTASNTIASASDPISTNSQRFYRIKLLP